MGAAADDGAGLGRTQKLELEITCGADAHTVRRLTQLAAHVVSHRGRRGNDEDLSGRHAGLKKVAHMGAGQDGLAGVGNAAHEHAGGVGRRGGAGRFGARAGTGGAGIGTGWFNGHVGHLFSARRAGRNG